MVLVPNLLEARAALDLDTSRRQRRNGHRLLPRQDPLGSLISIIVNGPPDENTLTDTSTTGRTTSTTPRAQSQTSTTSSRSPTSTPSRTSTSTTPTSTSTTTSASVVTNPPPFTPLTSTITSTSTQPVNTGSADANLTANTNSKSGLPSVVVGVIVAASVIFGLILIALIVRKFFQMRRRRRRGTWARGSLIAPFEPPLQEKTLPPPPPPKAPMADSQNRLYPAYPPSAVTFANNAPYSPVAPSSAGYPAPYAYGGNTVGVGAATTNAGMFNKTAYTPNDLAGPIVITPPTPSVNTSVVTVSVVKRTFVPSLPDELSIAVGDQVRVLSVYDDGWALCEKSAGGDRGVVPQECLESVTPSNSNAPKQQTVGSDEARLNRASSLRRGQDQTY